MWKRKNRTETLRFLRPDEITPNPWQARKNFSDEGLQRLAQSITRYGMLEPITVRECGSSYELLIGERRWRAAKLLELEKIPCRVAEVSPKTGAEMVLIENLMREDLNLFEEAQAMDRLLKNFSYTQTELAQRLGMSQSAVANKIRLLRLTTTERILICENALTERHARALLRISDPSARLFALEYLLEKSYNVRQTEAFVAALLDHPDEFLVSPKPKPKTKPKPIRRLVVRDVRLFVNSVDKAIFNIREAGFSVEAEKQEEEQYISYSIRIPKYSKE